MLVYLFASRTNWTLKKIVYLKFIYSKHNDLEKWAGSDIMSNIYIAHPPLYF